MSRQESPLRIELFGGLRLRCEGAETVADFLRRTGKFKNVLAPRDATAEEIERVHARGYVDLVRTEVAGMADFAGYLSTGDTVVDMRAS